MTTTLETSLPIPVLILGAAASIGVFLWLFRRERNSVGPVVRWVIPALRVVLCLLVWILIAQPRAVTTREETLPVTTRLGVDVSESMSLADRYGEHTDRWQEEAKPTPLEEATALAEAAKVRLHLLARHERIDQKERDEAIEKTRNVLEQVEKKIQSIGSSPELARLVQPSLEAVSRALDRLDQLTGGDAVSNLQGAARLTAQAVTGLRRIAEVLPEEISPALEDPRPRMDLVNRWLEETSPVFEALAEKGDLETFTFATTMAQVEIGEPFASSDALGGGTNLYGNLNRLASEESAAGRRLSLLITDGVDTGSPDTWTLSAQVRDQPLLVIPVGDPSAAPDVFIESVISPARVREEDTFVAQVELGSRNTGPEAVTVSLVDAGTVLDSREWEVDGSGNPEVLELEWTAAGLGQRDLRVELTSLDGEEILGNNQREVPCQVIKDQYRVLVCDGKPRWETRYLQNLFKRDRSIEMVSLVFAPRHAYPGQPLPPAPALPLALELWQKFDLVILGDVNPTQLTPDHQEVLVDYVDGGGNLLVLGGFDAMPAAFAGTPLERLLPMSPAQSEPILGTFVIQPPANRAMDPIVRLDEGEGQRVWQSLFTITPQHRLSAWSEAKESARTLLVAEDRRTGATRDFLALQRYGRGRVAFAAAPCLYHLRSTYGDRYHARFWGQLIRGICVDNFGFEGGLIKTRLDRSLWGAGAEIQGRVRLTTPGGLPMTNADFSALLVKEETIVAQMRPIPDPDRPGDYFIRFPDAEPGEFVIEYEGEDLEPLLESDRESHPEDSSRRLTVSAESFSQESQPAGEPSPFWNQVNALPLAATVTPQTLPLVIDALDLQPETITRTSSRPLWNFGTFLLAIILVSGAEWLLRRTNGLC